MVARTVFALTFLAAIGAGAGGPVTERAQENSIWVEVESETDEPEVEKRYTPELLKELELAKDNTMLLYTEFTARAGADLKMFIRNVSGLVEEAEKMVGWGLLDSAPESCLTEFHRRVRKISFDAQRAASFSAENHHKFFKGHMIVFRMHLNKSEDYIRKCENTIRTCGVACETTSKVARWRRLAKQEINRVFSDIQTSRRSYHDLLLHAHRKLVKLRRAADGKAKLAVEQLEECAKKANST